jgi:hypothetical protein
MNYPKSKPWGRAVIRFFALAVLIAVGFAGAARAADREIPIVKQAQYYHETDPYCGCRCGCPLVTYVHHRELGMRYSSGLDPRTRGEPTYYYGAMRTYARFERWHPEQQY